MSSLNILRQLFEQLQMAHRIPQEQAAQQTAAQTAQPMAGQPQQERPMALETGRPTVERPPGQFDMNGGRNVGRLSVGEPFIHQPAGSAVGDVSVNAPALGKHKVKLQIGPVQLEQNHPIDPKLLSALLKQAAKGQR